jgi:hypothetical protein
MEFHGKVLFGKFCEGKHLNSHHHFKVKYYVQGSA